MEGRVSESVIDPGDKLHVVTRRLFADEVRRHFAGEVVRVSGNVCEVRGYAFVFRPGTNEYRRRPEQRSRVLSVADAGHLVNKLPADVDIEMLRYRVVEGRLTITDQQGFTLDINEFGPVS